MHEGRAALFGPSGPGAGCKPGKPAARMDATAIVLEDSADQESLRIAIEVENWGRLRFRIILKVPMVVVVL